MSSIKIKRVPSLNVRMRSTLLWTIMGIYTLVLFAILIIIMQLKPKTRHKIIISWTWLFNWCAKYICQVTYEVRGIENIVDKPAIIASNHQSMWETLCFTQIFPQHVWVLKKELLNIPFFGWVLRFASPIGIDRGASNHALSALLEQGIDRFNNGFWILTFPEGTRLMPGDRKKYKLGTARLATLLNANILPVAHNAGSCYPKTGLCLYRGKITVDILPIIQPDPQEDPGLLTDKLELVINGALDKMD